MKRLTLNATETKVRVLALDHVLYEFVETQLIVSINAIVQCDVSGIVSFLQLSDGVVDQVSGSNDIVFQVFELFEERLIGRQRPLLLLCLQLLEVRHLSTAIKIK